MISIFRNRNYPIKTIRITAVYYRESDRHELVLASLILCDNRADQFHSNKQSSTFRFLEELKKENKEKYDKLYAELEKVHDSTTKAANDYTELVSTLLSISKDAAAERRRLKNPSFHAMIARQSEIPAAYAGTFQWMLMDDDPQSFVPWLLSGCGIYWIVAKEGSGKSTLVKYLFEHPTTEEKLRIWSKTSKLVTGVHYFSLSLGDVYNSQRGMLQNILTQVLYQCPDLGVQICTCHIQVSEGLPELGLWSLTELREAFRRLKQLKGTHPHFYFFIDGLDEQKGDAGDTVALLKDVTSISHIKICVSSTPSDRSDAYLDSFASHKLELQEFTSEDIKQYVESKLATDKDIKSILSERQWEMLRKCSVQRADGNFLWASSIVESLLAGLRKGDTMAELERRMDSMPDNLSGSYERSLDEIDTMYRPFTAQILLVLSQTAIAALPLFTVNAILDNSEDPDFALGASMIDVLKWDITDVTKRLNARTKDLLLISKVRGAMWPVELGLDQIHRVELRHQFVRNFLKGEDIIQKLHRWAPICSDPLTVLCRGLLLHIKKLPKKFFKDLHDVSVYSHIWAITEILKYQREYESIHHCSDVPLVDALAFTVSALIHQQAASERSQEWLRLLTSSDPDDLLAFAVGQRLTLYVAAKIQEQYLTLRATRERPFLDYALRGFRRLPRYSERPLMSDEEFRKTYQQDAKMVELLLRAGADPNERVCEGRFKTVWSRFLEQVMRIGHDLDTQKTTFMQLRLLIEHGADVLLKVDNLSPGH